MTPEEEARQKFIMRERDRERKRIKRMNPEYRQMERERDRFRKQTPRPSVYITVLYPLNLHINTHIYVDYKATQNYLLLLVLEQCTTSTSMRVTRE